LLTDQKQDELGAELCKKESLILDDPDIDIDDYTHIDEVADVQWTEWIPDPIDAPIGISGTIV
jgi:hypothetical protein